MRMNESRPRNPLAVALHYNGNGAPRVVAKGGGEVAEKILEMAREHKVPLQEDAALAATLSRIELGREIPRELFVAVAHVLAFAWSVAGKRDVKVTQPYELNQRR
jgi:flagellar biosynthesis protein